LSNTKYRIPNTEKMILKLTAFGIAKDILGKRFLEIEVENECTIADLKAILLEQYPDFSKLASLTFAVEEEYQNDDFLLSENQEIVIIPPVAGG
jgi:molybdopterin converting factor small subunit